MLKMAGERILELRKKAGFSQTDIARVLKIPRTAVGMIEKGKREICGNELTALSKLFNVTTDFLLGLEEKSRIRITRDGGKAKKIKDEVRISIPQKNIEKFKQILLYILERCAGKPNIGETVLYKLLYFADFNYYELYEEQMTGARYRKLQYGPVPMEFSEVVDRMVKKNELAVARTDYYGYPQKRYIPNIKADLNMLKATEKDVIDKVIELMSDWNAAKISNYSHEDVPWKVTKEGEDINYEFVFYRVKPYSVREYEEEDD
ncbi:MAG: DUF4065 domain-containing protein [Candidatus Goldbacteria bacterium]|nr:DUF4065 domain-containing protein [Candidatus Goldiibacteriota bacterium]